MRAPTFAAIAASLTMLTVGAGQAAAGGWGYERPRYYAAPAYRYYAPPAYRPAYYAPRYRYAYRPAYFAPRYRYAYRPAYFAPRYRYAYRPAYWYGYGPAAYGYRPTAYPGYYYRPFGVYAGFGWGGWGRRGFGIGIGF